MYSLDSIMFRDKKKFSSGLTDTKVTTLGTNIQQNENLDN
jgi:hypothetical protein